MKHKIKMSVLLKTVAALATASFFLAACDSNQDRGTGILVNNPPDLTQQDNVQNNQSYSHPLQTVWGNYNPADPANLVRMTGSGGRSEYTINYTFMSGVFGKKFRLLEAQMQTRNSFCNQGSYFEMSLIDQFSGTRVPVELYQEIEIERNTRFTFKVVYRPGCNSVDWQFNPIVFVGQ